MFRTLTYAAGLLSLVAATIALRSSVPVAPRIVEGTIVRRIASLSPSTTEFCAALGLTDRLVARSSYCKFPPAVQRLPSVGGLVDLDYERLLHLRPDLVLVSGRSQQSCDTVTALGLRAISLPDSTLEDVFTSLTMLGHVTDRDEIAWRKVAAIRRELATLARPARPQDGKRVLLVVTPSRIPPGDPWVGLPGSYVDALLNLAGHTNAMPASGLTWSGVSLESVVRADPDVIIEFWPDDAPADDSIAMKAWSMVGPMKAVRDKRIYVIRGDQHYIPGPRVAETLRAMIAVLGP